MKEITTI